MNKFTIPKNTEKKILKLAANVTKAYDGYQKQSTVLTRSLKPLVTKAIRSKNIETLETIVVLTGDRYLGKLDLYLTIQEIKQKEKSKRIKVN